MWKLGIYEQINAQLILNHIKEGLYIYCLNTWFYISACGKMCVS